MEASEQIQKFQEFIEKYYLADLLEQVRKGKRFIVIDFAKLTEFDPELSEDLLENPEDTIKAAEMSIEHFDIGDNKNFRVRFFNFPQSATIKIKDIRSHHLNKIFQIDGIVKQKSDVRPQVTNAKFECPSCGKEIKVLQLDTKFREPFRCVCGKKGGKFKLISKELMDVQMLVIEEAPETLEGGDQPKRINVFLKEDLVSPLTEKKTNPGNRIYVVGIVKEVPIVLKTGGQSTRYDLLIEANYVTSVSEEFSEVAISEEDVKKIIEISERPDLFEALSYAIAPSIYGHEKIKEALLLQLMGGVKKVRDDKVTTRGDMHILLIGDPGSGKSQLLKRISVVAPKARYVSGKGASGAGITASVVRDEFLRGWSLEAGALVLANKGMCMIDELDKMSKEDTSAMHEALEQQTITISKANILATLVAETTVLAAANPKLGRFNPYGNIADQIDLPPTLLNRFDLIFPIKDIPDKTRDEVMARFVLKLHQTTKSGYSEIPTSLLRKYIAYAKMNFTPILSDEALERIKDYYVDMRNSDTENSLIKRIPITARQLEALVRLAEASARTRLSNKVTKADAERAIDLLNYCLMQVAFDTETGKIDIDKLSTGITASQRSHIVIIKEIIAELEEKMGKDILLTDVFEEAKKQNISYEKVEEVIERLRRSGDLFEPKKGFIRRM